MHPWPPRDRDRLDPSGSRQVNGALISKVKKLKRQVKKLSSKLQKTEIGPDRDASGPTTSLTLQPKRRGSMPADPRPGYVWMMAPGQVRLRSGTMCTLKIGWMKKADYLMTLSAQVEETRSEERDQAKANPQGLKDQGPPGGLFLVKSPLTLQGRPWLPKSLK